MRAVESFDGKRAAEKNCPKIIGMTSPGGCGVVPSARSSYKGLRMICEALYHETSRVKMMRMSNFNEVPCDFQGATHRKFFLPQVGAFEVTFSLSGACLSRL